MGELKMNSFEKALAKSYAEYEKAFEDKKLDYDYVNYETYFSSIDFDHYIKWIQAGKPFIKEVYYPDYKMLLREQLAMMETTK